METKKLSKQEFVLKAIDRLHTEKSKGIHVVWSGLNAAFQRYFGEPSRATTDEMAAKGLIDIQPIVGGVMIYKKGDAPDRTKEIVDKNVA